MSSISRITTDRARLVLPVRLVNGTVSQWFAVQEYRSCFCIAQQSTPSAWIIEGLLPDGSVISLAQYDNDLFDPTNPRYVTMKAMCGLPIRFVAATQQVDPQLWVVFKS